MEYPYRVNNLELVNLNKFASFLIESVFQKWRIMAYDSENNTTELAEFKTKKKAIQELDVIENMLRVK
jgi:hypothetical protein